MDEKRRDIRVNDRMVANSAMQILDEAISTHWPLREVSENMGLMDDVMFVPINRKLDPNRDRAVIGLVNQILSDEAKTLPTDYRKKWQARTEKLTHEIRNEGSCRSLERNRAKALRRAHNTGDAGLFLDKDGNFAIAATPRVLQSLYTKIEHPASDQERLPEESVNMYLQKQVDEKVDGLYLRVMPKLDRKGRLLERGAWRPRDIQNSGSTAIVVDFELSGPVKERMAIVEGLYHKVHTATQKLREERKKTGNKRTVIDPGAIPTFTKTEHTVRVTVDEGALPYLYDTLQKEDHAIREQIRRTVALRTAEQSTMTAGRS